jgi:hypothetical protein
MRAIKILPAVIVALLTVAAAVPTAAFACDPSTNDPSRTRNETAYLDGWVRGVSGSIVWSNVESNIEVRDPHVDNNPNMDNKSNASYPWDMLVTNDQQTAWAQIGPAKHNDGYRSNFIQCFHNTDPSPTDIFIASSTIGSTPTYKIVNDGAMGSKDFYINGSEVAVCGYSFTPGAVELGTEIHDRNDEIQGTVSDHEGFTNSTAHDSSGASYDLLASGGHINSSPPAWLNVKNAGPEHMEGWDGDCPS